MNDAVDDLSSMSLVTINNLLPTEILFKIFSLLPLQTLKKAMLVCRWWRQVGEDSRLWSNVKLKLLISPVRRSFVRGYNVYMPKLLRTKRLQGVQFLHLDCRLIRKGYGSADDMLQAILDHPCLEYVSYFHPPGDIGDKLFSPSLLSKVVASRKSFCFETGDLPIGHLDAIFNAIDDCTSLKKFMMNGTLYRVAPDVLAKAVTRIEEVDMGWAALSDKHIDSIMKRSLEPDSKLKMIHLKSTYNRIHTTKDDDPIREAMKTVVILWCHDLDIEEVW